MKNFRCKVKTKLNSKIVSSISLISFGLICTSDISEAMIPTPNSVFKLFSRMSTSLGRFFRSSKSNQPKTHKISKSFDSSFSQKSVLSTTFGTPESSKTSKIKLTKFSDNSTGKSSTSISSNATLHKPKVTRKNFYEVDQSYSTSESSTPTNSNPPTPRRSKQAVSSSPSLIIRNFEASLRRRDEEFNKMFEQNMKLKKEDFKGSQEILKNIRKEVNIKFLGHSSKS